MVKWIKNSLGFKRNDVWALIWLVMSLFTLVTDEGLVVVLAAAFFVEHSIKHHIDEKFKRMGLRD